MQYILSEEEYKALIPKKEYDELEYKLESEIYALGFTIRFLEKEALKDYICPKKDKEGYCDECGLGKARFDKCRLEDQIYKNVKK